MTVETIVTADPISLPSADSAAHRVEAQLALVTPQMAGEWISRWRYPRQRGFYPRLAATYADIMNEGEWTISTLTVAEYTGPTSDAVEHGARFLLNGYHRLEGLVMADVSLAFVVEVHRVRNEDDIHALYAAQDRGRSRSLTDVFRSFGLADDLGWKEGELRMVAETYSLISNGFRPVQKSLLSDPYARADFVRDWKSEGRDWIDCFRLAGWRKYAGYLTASPVSAVAMATLRHQRERALTFWMDVARNDGLRAGTPEHTLATFLLSTRVREMKVQTYARYVAAAWNAAYRERGLVKLQIHNPDLPIRILGTPFIPPKPATAEEEDAE